MSEQVVAGAVLQCSYGVSPSALVVPPTNRVVVENLPAANIMDHKPVANIPTFGMCTTKSNPAVAAATAASVAAGKPPDPPTPAPCVPATSSPWTPGAATVLIANQPALNKSSTCNCSYGGVISITNAGSVKTQIP